jgi:hypothetical protein
MGSGPTTKPSTAKSTDLAADGAGSPSSPCQEPHLYEATFHAGTTLAAGMAVRIELSLSVTTIAGDRAIGELAGADREFARMCLASGYRLRGSIVTVDSTALRGVVRVDGVVRRSPPP